MFIFTIKHTFLNKSYFEGYIAFFLLWSTSFQQYVENVLNSKYKCVFDLCSKSYAVQSRPTLRYGLKSTDSLPFIILKLSQLWDLAYLHVYIDLIAPDLKQHYRKVVWLYWIHLAGLKIVFYTSIPISTTIFDITRRNRSHLIEEHSSKKII